MVIDGDIFAKFGKFFATDSDLNFFVHVKYFLS